MGLRTSPTGAPKPCAELSTPCFSQLTPLPGALLPLLWPSVPLSQIAPAKNVGLPSIPVSLILHILSSQGPVDSASKIAASSVSSLPLINLLPSSSLTWRTGREFLILSLVWKVTEGLFLWRVPIQPDHVLSPSPSLQHGPCSLLLSTSSAVVPLLAHGSHLLTVSSTEFNQIELYMFSVSGKRKRLHHRILKGVSSGSS